MADDIVAWLNRCIDEDERVAKAAIQPTSKPAPIRGVWTAGEHPMGYVSADDFELFDEGTFTQQHAEHIARHDPSRVLRGVVAKRKILELHTPWTAAVGAWSQDRSQWCNICRAEEGPEAWPCPTLLALALPYSGKDGWDPSWTVDA